MPAMVHNSESLLAFLIMAVFMLAYLIYKTTSPGDHRFPLVFLLDIRGGNTPATVPSHVRAVTKRWLFAHIGLIFTGYAALVLSFCASVLYLIQERALKSKRDSGILSRLPALEDIDQIGYRSLLLGFPVHDARPDRGIGGGAEQLRAHRFSRIRKYCFRC